MYTKNQALNYLKGMKGRYIDFDNFYGMQCMDVSVDYAYRISGGSVRLWGNACDIYRNKFPEGWVIQKYYKGYVPPVGAIVQFGGGFYSSYGHTGIVWDNSGGSSYFTILEQNWDGRADSPAKLRTDYYNNVLYFVIPPMLVEKEKPTRYTAPLGKSFKGKVLPSFLNWSEEPRCYARAGSCGVRIAVRKGKPGAYRFEQTDETYPPGTLFTVYEVSNGWARIYAPHNNGWIQHNRLIVD